MTKMKSSGSPHSIAAKLVKDSRVANAFQIIDEMLAELMREHIKVTEIPAPIFAEATRGQYFRDRFQEIGLVDVKTDAVGNVTACWPAPAPNYLCLSAHLDTVFPASTDCR